MASELVPVLAATLSADVAFRLPAEETLKKWELLPKFHESLLEVVAAKQLESSIRIQAALVFKNSIERWRKTNPAAIDLQSKAVMRRKLMSLLDEENETIAKILALCFGKIARLDYDTDWPSLPDELLTIMAQSINSNNIVLHRTLLVTKQVVKALMGNRLPRGRLLMQQLGPRLFTPLSQLYTQRLDISLNALQNFDPGKIVTVVFDLHILLLSIKILRDLLRYGWMNIDLHSEPTSFLSSTISHTRLLWLTRLSLLETSKPLQIVDMIAKILYNLGKLYKQSYKVQVASQPIFEVYWSFVLEASSHVQHISDLSSPYPEKLIVQALLIIRNILSIWPSIDDPGRIPISSQDNAFYAQLRIWSQEATSTLVSSLIPMRSVEIELWRDDPEAALNEEEADRDELDLRPAAIRLMADLLNQFRSVVGSTLVSMLSSNQIRAPRDNNDLLIKEALYSALGRNPTNVLEAMATFKPFDRWLHDDLIPELHHSSMFYGFIRRRILWLLGSWVGEEISPGAKMEVYQYLVYFVKAHPADNVDTKDVTEEEQSHDVATRLTAARSLGKCDSWGFDETVFKPYLEEAMQALLTLMDDVETIESRMRLMDILGVIIDRMGEAIAPHAIQLLTLLPGLWQNAAGQNLFKVSIMVVVSKLTEAIGIRSQQIQPQLCALVSYGVNPANEEYAYLNEEAIELWRSVLRYASALTPDLASLLPLVVGLLQAGTDTLPNALKILESYCLLDADILLQNYGTEVFTSFELLLGDQKMETVKTLLHAFNLLISRSHPTSWRERLDASNCFTKLVQPLNKEESALIRSKYLGSLSRIVVADVEGFYALLQSTASKANTSYQALLEQVLDSCIELNDNLGTARHRKLAALALSFLLRTNEETTLVRIPHFAPIWLSVLAETDETDQGDASAYSILDAYDSEGEYDGQESPEADRKTAARLLDPVHSMKLSSVIQTNLSIAQARNGGHKAFFEHYLSSLDPLILDELNRRLSGTLKG